MQAFFMNSNDSTSLQYGLEFIPVEGPPIMQSCVMNGVFLQLPLWNTLSTETLNLSDDDLKVAVFSVSLAGDQSGNLYIYLNS